MTKREEKIINILENEIKQADKLLKRNYMYSYTLSGGELVLWFEVPKKIPRHALVIYTKRKTELQIRKEIKIFLFEDAKRLYGVYYD